MRSMVERDRNHPSVILWSIGNEIPMRFTRTGANLSAVMRDFIHSLDPGSGRAVTSAYPLIHEQDSPFLHNLEVDGCTLPTLEPRARDSARNLTS
jgi:beta-galactosidase